jgi:hypothetical protein
VLFSVLSCAQVRVDQTPQEGEVRTVPVQCDLHRHCMFSPVHSVRRPSSITARTHSHFPSVSRSLPPSLSRGLLACFARHARAHVLWCRSLARASSRSTWCVRATGVLNWGTSTVRVEVNGTGVLCNSHSLTALLCWTTYSSSVVGGLVAEANSSSDPRGLCVFMVPLLLLRVASSWVLKGTQCEFNGTKSARSFARRTRATDAPMLQRDTHNTSLREGGHVWCP